MRTRALDQKPAALQELLALLDRSGPEIASSAKRFRNVRHKRVVVTHYGGPEVITAIEEDIPTPKPGEIRSICVERNNLVDSS